MANQRNRTELRHLRYFVAAADHGSFRKAAYSLGIQESAVSRRIRDLEDQLGASLFQRHNSGVTLTLAGQRFLRRIRTALQHIGDGARDINAIGRSEDGHINIGILSSLASGFLHDLLLAFSKKHSGVRIDFIDGNPAEHVAAVRQLKLDVAFIAGVSEWQACETARLWSEKVFAVLPDGHSLVRKDELGWSDLAGEIFIVSDVAPGQEIQDYLVQRLADLGHHPEIRLQYVGRDNLLPLVALGRGLTLISEAMTAAQIPGVSYRVIGGEILPFSAVWSPRNDNPACRKLLSLARAMARRSNERDIRLPALNVAQTALPSRSPDLSQ
ncbi:LysR family transcriptional regulator [Bradyrhizobium sp. Leo121]|uniref:LysR family transcriptional regulator n=1 Tax=Bradyrhizobium sp. Leo121 TaxID=1571195 RepID=UPI00102A1C5A|nr:LysR family transcriptional regulator [Bradyrhizobium sp. Leo121]RZN31705.1 LysR family transcriptional regulator [Bradyrhizobium sp. Leo121]